jgi:hypothetical protein
MTQRSVRRPAMRPVQWLCLLIRAAIPAPALGSAADPGATSPPQQDPQTVHVYHGQGIHFAPRDSSRYDTVAIHASQAGRVISRTLDLDPPPYPAAITARVAIHPVPKDAESVHDRWDRAGNVRLVRPGSPPIELLKFVTAYGGETEHRADVTFLGSVLRGPVTIEGFIDTWVSPAWTMDLTLECSPVPDSSVVAGGAPADGLAPVPDRVIGVLYEDSWTAEPLGAGGRGVPLEIPAGARRVVLHYLASGHCTDGRGGEEFERRRHWIEVDGLEVERLEPWRSDCRAFRSINPYCRRWSDGSWSADYSRSGWCPGDAVPPHPIDLTAVLTPGPHELRVRIPGIRPRGADGHFGYWRVSAYLLVWTDAAAARR